LEKDANRPKKKGRRSTRLPPRKRRKMSGHRHTVRKKEKKGQGWQNSISTKEEYKTREKACTCKREKKNNGGVGIEEKKKKHVESKGEKKGIPTSFPIAEEEKLEPGTRPFEGKGKMKRKKPCTGDGKHNPERISTKKGKGEEAASVTNNLPEREKKKNFFFEP